MTTSTLLLLVLVLLVVRVRVRNTAKYYHNQLLAISPSGHPVQQAAVSSTSYFVLLRTRVSSSSKCTYTTDDLEEVYRHLLLVSIIIYEEASC